MGSCRNKPETKSQTGKDRELLLREEQMSYGWLRQWWIGLACEVNRL
ncbi:hypothetical protein [Prochlorococcus marinus]|nr:hypothetical protein [Prochlorococcus marinus]